MSTSSQASQKPAKDSARSFIHYIRTYCVQSRLISGGHNSTFSKILYEVNAYLALVTGESKLLHLRAPYGVPPLSPQLPTQSVSQFGLRDRHRKRRRKHHEGAAMEGNPRPLNQTIESPGNLGKKGLKVSSTRPNDFFTRAAGGSGWESDPAYFPSWYSVLMTLSSGCLVV